MPNNVTYAGGCIKYIKSKNTALLTQEQVFEVVSIIQGGRLKPSVKTNREHVAHVKAIIESKENEKPCPKCGSKMILRESKRGVNVGNQFWGCSSFPKCRAMERQPVAWSMDIPICQW